MGSLYVDIFCWCWSLFCFVSSLFRRTVCHPPMLPSFGVVVRGWVSTCTDGGSFSTSLGLSFSSGTRRVSMERSLAWHRAGRCAWAIRARVPCLGEIHPGWLPPFIPHCLCLSINGLVWMTKTSTMTRGMTRRRKGKRGGVSPPIPSSVGTKWDGERSVLRFTLFNRPWAVAEGREKRNPTGRSTDFIRPSHPQGWRGRVRQRGSLSMGGRALVTWPYLPFPPSTRASTKSIWINIGASPPNLTKKKTSLASNRRFVDTRHRTKRWNAIQPALLGDGILLPSPIDAILPRSQSTHNATQRMKRNPKTCE